MGGVGKACVGGGVGRRVQDGRSGVVKGMEGRGHEAVCVQDAGDKGYVGQQVWGAWYECQV